VKIAPWDRPAFQPTGRTASVRLIAFAEEDVLTGADLELRDAVPVGAPADALTLGRHLHADDPDWFDGWRTDGLRNMAVTALGDLAQLDAATCCYSITIELNDPADLTFLQLAWAVASALSRAGSFATLDVYACNWHHGAGVATLPPERPFSIQDEVSLIAETEPSGGFGHPVHTRGMIKFGRPDLIAGVPVERIEHTGRILNHLARMLAEGNVLVPGQRLRFDGERTLTVTPYEPDGTTPDVALANDGLLLVDS